jgi:hypothetical protein
LTEIKSDEGPLGIVVNGMNVQEARSEAKNMSPHYTTISALIFAIVAAAHLLRLFRRWKVQVGPMSVPMPVSWVGLVVSALLAVWGFQN